LVSSARIEHALGRKIHAKCKPTLILNFPSKTVVFAAVLAPVGKNGRRQSRDYPSAWNKPAHGALMHDAAGASQRQDGAAAALLPAHNPASNVRRTQQEVIFAWK
jgi:hypothetical protein